MRNLTNMATGCEVEDAAVMTQLVIHENSGIHCIVLIMR